MAEMARAISPRQRLWGQRPRLRGQYDGEEERRTPGAYRGFGVSVQVFWAGLLEGVPLAGSAGV